MHTNQQLANRFREVILNGKWIANTNYKESLIHTDWQLATKEVYDLNTLALLAQHIHYYIGGVLQVFEGGSLDIRDKYSFDFPPIQSQEDWENRLKIFFEDTEKLAQHIEQTSDEKLEGVFVDEKYGTYQRNIDVLIEHAYYHLGQVSLIKKIISKQTY